MDELKAIVAENISRLRTLNSLTQAQLGEMLSYSDKAVSKWERGDAIPDVYVLKKMSDIFNVSVDYLLEPHDEVDIKPAMHDNKRKHSLIVGVAFLGVWTLSLLVFIILAFLGKTYWLIFAYTLPISLITLLVLNTVWSIKKINIIYISALVWSILLAIYLSLIDLNWWLIFVLGIPAEIIIFLCFKIKRHK